MIFGGGLREMEDGGSRRFIVSEAIEGKVVLITGGGTGLGAETARHLASKGAIVAIVVDMNPDGTRGAGRYTDDWQFRDGRWQCVSAHFSRA